MINLKLYHYDTGWCGSVTVISSNFIEAAKVIYDSKAFQTYHEEHKDIYTLTWLENQLKYSGRPIYNGMTIYSSGDL